MESRFSLRALIVTLMVLGTPAFGTKQAKDSLYQVRSTWTDSSGKKLKLSELAGGPVVVAMVYTKCKYTCPLILTKLKSIEKALAEKPATKYVLISFDYKNDTPAVMKAFMEEKQLDASRWKVLAGQSSGSIREMAALLDTAYKEEKDGEFSHSNVITLLDQEGVKIAQVNGLAADHSALVAAAKALP